MSKGEKSGPVLKDAPKHLSIQDITEQKAHLKKPKERSEAIKSNEAKVFSLFNDIWDGIVILNSEGKVIEANPAYCLMLGYAKNEILGTPVSKYIHPDKLKNLDSFQKQIETNGKGSLESVYIHKDGTSIPIEVRGISCTYLGQQVLLGVVRDISERKQSEKELKGTMTQLTLLESLPAVPYTCKAEGDFGASYISPRVTEVAGYHPEDFTSNASFWADHIHPDDRERVFSHLHKIFEEGTCESEYRFKIANGEYKWFGDISRLIKTQEGKIDHITGIWQDITDRKLAEEQLQQSKEQYKMLIDNSPDMVFSSRLDDFKIVSVNERGCKEYGYSRKEFLNMTIFDLEVDPPTQERIKTIYASMKIGDTNEIYGGLNKRKDGSTFRVHVRFTKIDEEHEIAHVRDISKQMKAADDLREMNEKLERRVLERTQHLKDAGKLFEGIFSNLAEAVFVIDPATRKIISCNRAVEKIFGYTKEEVIGYNTEFLHVDREHYEQFGKKMVPALYVEGIFSIDFHFKRKNTEIFPTENTVTDIKNEMGQPTALVSVVRDNTERKEALKALRQSKEAARVLAGRLISSQEEESRRLARELHDDFTQRLAVVAIALGKLDSILTSSSDPVYRQIKEIKEQVVKLSTDLNDISRRLHPSIIDDLGLAAAIKSECMSFSRREETQVEYDSEVLPPTLSKDISLCIYRIVQEGLRNIAKHSQAKKVNIRLTSSDDQVILSICDDGIGFDPPRIKKKGGFGLASMEERVRLVKGLLSIQSHPGQGTEINVLTPLSGEG